MILYLTWGKSFSRFFVKYLRMLVVVGGDGWVHRYGAGSFVTIMPTPTPEWNMNDNVKRLVNRARTLSKLRSNGEEDYEEEWAGIGRMVSAEAFEFGLYAGEDTQEGSRD